MAAGMAAGMCEHAAQIGHGQGCLEQLPRHLAAALCCIVRAGCVTGLAAAGAAAGAIIDAAGGGGDAGGGSEGGCAPCSVESHSNDRQLVLVMLSTARHCKPCRYVVPCIDKKQQTNMS